MKRALSLLCLVLCAAVTAAADEPVDLIVYGPDAPAAEGDPDHRQELLVVVPEAHDGQVSMRLWDPDTGGEADALFATADTTIRVVVRGAGDEILADSSFADDPDADGRWVTVATVDASAGETGDGIRSFKVEISGSSGDDGNVYRFGVSADADLDTPVPGTEILAESLTVRHPGRNVAAEHRFRPDGADSIAITTFDVAGATTTVATSRRSIPVSASGRGDSREAIVSLAADEAQGAAAVVIDGDGGEAPNDYTIRVATTGGDPLPILLPVTEVPLDRRPEPVIRAELLADCLGVGLDASASRDPDGDPLVFTWELGDGTTAMGTKVVHAYEEPGVYRVRLRADDTTGRVASRAETTTTVRINAPPVAEAGPDLVAAPGETVRLGGTGSSDPEGEPLSGTWNLGDGSQEDGLVVSHAYARPGRYLAELRVEDGSESPCDWATDTALVRVNAPPVAEAGGDLVTVVGETVTLDAGRSYDTDGELVRSVWILPDGRREGERVETSFPAPGSYEVTLEVQDDSGAGNDVVTDTISVLVNDPPTAQAGADRRVAVGEVTIFDASASSDADGRIVSYAWDFGDGNRGGGRTVPYAYRGPGTYTARLSVRDDSLDAPGTATDEVTVVVNAPPVADAGPDVRVTASVVAFDASGSSDPDGRLEAFSWDFGDGRTGEGPRPEHTYLQPGVYVATLSVRDESGTSSDTATDTLTVVINQRPVADAGPDRVVAPGEELTLDGGRSFDPDGSITRWSWDFGDGASAEGRQVSHAFDAPGRYTVGLVVGDDTGDAAARDHDAAVVEVNAAPTALAGADLRVAPGEAFTLDGSRSMDPEGGELSFRWELPGGGIVAGPSIEHRLDEAGSHHFRLTVTDPSGVANGFATDEVTVRVNHRPVAVVSAPRPTCDRAVVLDASGSLDPDGDPLRYRWDLGDGSTAEGRWITRVYAEGGEYPVTLTVDDGTGLANASHTAATSVVINRAPEAVAGDDQLLCAGEVALLDGSASSDPEEGALRYHWEFSDGVTESTVNPTRIFKTGGVYTATLSIQDDSGLSCDSDSDALTLRVVESPSAVAGEDRSVCANTPVLFDGSASSDFDGVVNAFRWDFGDGSTGGGPRVEHVYTEPGTYPVLLTVTGDQVAHCDSIDRDEISVEVLPAPVASLEVPDVVPVGSEVVLDGSGSQAEGLELSSFRWDFGDDSAAEGSRVTHSWDEAGRYTVSLTVSTGDVGTCSAVTARRTVLVNLPPLAEAGEERVVGVAEPVFFDGSESSDPDGRVVDWQWDFGDGHTGEGVTARHAYDAPGRYTATLRVADDSGIEEAVATDVVEVVVNAAPEPVISAPAAVCPGQEVVLDGAASSDPEGVEPTLAWLLGPGQEASGPEVIHQWSEPGLHQVVLVADDGSGVGNARSQALAEILVNRPPVADAGADRLICPGEVVSFDASASSDPEGGPLRSVWSFGDTGPAADHAWSEPGVHEVALTVTDTAGTSCSEATDTVKVRVNTSPVADAGGDRTGFTGGAHDAMLFDGAASSDADGDALTYRWDFGDGTSGRGRSLLHSYREPGTYQVTLSVDDGTVAGCSVATDTVEVTVMAR